MHVPSFLGAATVGERGQIAIPADARRAFGIEPGDKLIFFTGPKNIGLFMVKAEELGRLVNHFTEKAKSIEQMINQVNEE